MASAKEKKPNCAAHRNVVSQPELQRAFTRRAHKLWRRLHEDHRRVLQSCSENAIHDLRVATRRLQSMVELAAFSRPNKPGAKLRKRLKRLRHTLGRRRDVDVILGKLKERVSNTASAQRRRVLRSVIQQISSEARQITKEMYRETEKTGIKNIKHLAYNAADGEHLKDLSVGGADRAIRQAEQKWFAAIVRAKARRDPTIYHDVRIKAKSLRYTIESVSHITDVPGADATTEWLKTVQDELGEWHDEVELTRRVTEVLSRADYPADHAAVGLIRSLTDRAEASTGFASKLIMSLRDSWIRRKNVVLPFSRK
jgi:CHAD domain-containing protein